MITPSATNPKVTDRKLWDAFRTCGRDDQQGMVWAAHRDQLKGKKIAVVHDRTTYGKGLADAALDNMHKFGIKEVLYEGVNAGEKDYSAIVSKVEESGADYLMWGGLHTEGGLIVRQMRQQGMKTVMISGDGITDSEFAAMGGPGVEGTLMTFGPEPRLTRTRKRRWRHSRPRGSTRRATPSIPTPPSRSSSRRRRRRNRSIRRRSPPPCIRACRSIPSSAT